MKVRLTQLDGKFPNLALMRLSAFYKSRGDQVFFTQKIDRDLFEPDYEHVYGSSIFKFTAEKTRKFMQLFPHAVVGGTGTDSIQTVDEIDGSAERYDYTIYPEFTASIGFTQRGCRLSCKFCVVPAKEGKINSLKSIWEIYRGSPFPRNLLLLDNDFFGSGLWKDNIREMVDGKFKVCFTQGINARLLSDEAAEALASVHFTDDSFRKRRIYTAWDNRNDEEKLFAGLSALTRYGVKPDSIMVYMLIGYWDGETEDDREYRRKKLRDFGVRPYPMPFVRTKELIGFQRWVVGAYDKRFPWDDWKENNYRPENLYWEKNKMHGKIYDINVSSDSQHPVVIFSPSWGLLGKFITLIQAREMLGRISIPSDHPFQIGHGHKPQDGEIWTWKNTSWVKSE